MGCQRRLMQSTFAQENVLLSILSTTFTSRSIVGANTSAMSLVRSVCWTLQTECQSAQSVPINWQSLSLASCISRQSISRVPQLSGHTIHLIMLGASITHSVEGAPNLHSALRTCADLCCSSAITHHIWMAINTLVKVALALIPSICQICIALHQSLHDTLPLLWANLQRKKKKSS